MSIGTQNIDLRVDYNSSCKNLVIADHSYYLDIVEFPKIQILLPGSDNWFTFDFEQSKYNKFNSFDFNLSPEDSLVCLPDGLYEIKYSICPHDENLYKYYHLRQCQAWSEWKDLLISSFDSCFDICEESEKTLNKIEYLLKGAEAYNENCDNETALLLHQKALKLLKNLKCQIN